MGFGWHMDAGMRGCGDARIYYIYIHRKNKKVVLYRGLRPPLSPWPTALWFALQGTLSPVIPLAYGIMVIGSWMGIGIYARARIRIVTGSISVARSIVPVCRDGMTSRNSFLSSPKMGLLIFT